MDDTTGELMTPEEAADLLGIPRSAVITRIQEGHLQAIRLPSAQGKLERYRVKFGDLIDSYGEDLLTVDQVAADLKVSRRYVYYLIQNDLLFTVQLPSRRTGKPWGHRIPRYRLTAFKAQLEQKAAVMPA